MKISRYIMGAALVAAGLLATSCDTDNVGTIYNAQQQNVSLQQSALSSTTSDTEGDFTVRVVRSMTGDSYTAHYTFTGDDVFTDEGNGTVTFPAGQGYADIKVHAAGMSRGSNYNFTITLDDAAKATADTTIHHSSTTGNVYTATYEVTCDYTWVSMGTGKFSSEAMGDDNGPATWEVKVLKADGFDVYKAVDCYEKGYDVIFVVNSDNTVSVARQNAWTYTGYGPVAVEGTGTKTGNVLDCKLHHILVSQNYDFGAFTEVLTLPE